MVKDPKVDVTKNEKINKPHQAWETLTASGMTEIETGKSERTNHRVGQMNLKNEKNDSFQFQKFKLILALCQ